MVINHQHHLSVVHEYGLQPRFDNKQRIPPNLKNEGGAGHTGSPPPVDPEVPRKPVQHRFHQTLREYLRWIIFLNTEEQQQREYRGGGGAHECTKRIHDAPFSNPDPIKINIIYASSSESPAESSTGNLLRPQRAATTKWAFETLHFDEILEP